MFPTACSRLDMPQSIRQQIVRGLMLCAAALWIAPSAGEAADLLVEAESFEQHGGWKLDTQFIDEMGSPYLLAHGLGRPVSDATTEIEVPEAGEYHVFVRTKDWVARWKAPGTPGRFQIGFGDQLLETEFGTKSAEWFWHPGGTVSLPRGTVQLRLHDLTGFDGRCDAIYLTTTGGKPPVESSVLARWRRQKLGLDSKPAELPAYDLVVVGGGYSGMGTALSAARMGCKVALIQNRPVLGGNGSSEVRVWSMGLIRRGKFPRIGEIVDEFCDHATKSPGRKEEFEDEKKEAIVRAEPNIDLFLNHHAYKVETRDNWITAVHAFDTRTSEERRFTGQLFADCTGHGTIGYLANADWDMTPKGRMGMSNMWAWDELEAPQKFPETPWALQLDMKDFPYPRDHHGQWFWEGGFDKDPIGDAEGIRDWNLRAVYGAFSAMKNGDGAADHPTAILTWVAFIGGPRESRRLMGDVVLTQEDIVDKKEFDDGCVPSTWSIDLHYPKKQYLEKYPENPFISVAVHDRRIDRQFGYPVPYRCFYSRNIGNLFMAGRCISVTHEALGTTRVMKTCGMMGEVVGKATCICIQRNCTPREVYQRYLPDLKELLQLPGKARRATVDDEIEIPEDALPLAGPYGPPSGLDPRNLPGLIVDNKQAKIEGQWTSGEGLKGFVNYDYLYAGADSGASVTWEFAAERAGEFEVRLAYRQHPNRGSNVPVTVTTGTRDHKQSIDMREPPPLEHGFISLGKFDLRTGQKVSVTMHTKAAGGFAHADAIQILPWP